jgi:uncharacterized RDD family membrane protein YckC
MDIGVSTSGTAANLPRGGFWRRWLTIVIDTIIVMLPFQVLAAILFNLTAGMVQMDSGFFSVCAATKDIPQFLSPPPPHDSNFARVCRISFFGAPTGAFLTVSRITREGNTTTNVSQGYMLDKDGNPVHGTAIDWIVTLALLAYLVGMISRTGRTYGARVAGLRVVDTANPSLTEVPIRKVIVRYLAMAIGFVPMLAIFIYQYATVGRSADAIFTADFFRVFTYTAVIAFVWCVALVFQIARKRDPYYDRLAGTAVVRRQSQPPNPVPP